MNGKSELALALIQGTLEPKNKTSRHIKHFHEFKCFLNRKKVVSWVAAIRKENDIKVNYCKKLLGRYVELANSVDKTNREVTEKQHKLLDELLRYIENKHSSQKIEQFIKEYEMPYYWRMPFIRYVFTGDITVPYLRYSTFKEGEVVFIELSHYATKRDFEDALLSLEDMQKK